MKYLFGLIAVLLVTGSVYVIFQNQAKEKDPLSYYGVTDLSLEEKVLALDQQTLDGNIIGAGILERELIIQTTEGEMSYPVDEDLFYLSFAPYIERTHPCHNHNLVTCRSELANETMSVTITKDDGTVYLDETVTMFDNGFYGLWLSSNANYTIEVDYEGKTVTTSFETFSDSGTCLTEPLQLS